MKERPIVFSAQMISAIIEGRKTQTRCFVTGIRRGQGITKILAGDESERELVAATEKYAVGDRLWVRETWFTPRSASRLTLEITDVRVQRLQEISEEDARAEGAKRVAVDPVGELWEFEYGPGNTVLGKLARNGFIHLWDSINGKRAPWASNPWVWALTFRRLQ